MTRTFLLAGLVALVTAAASPAQSVRRFRTFPPEGVVMTGPQLLVPARIGGGYKVQPCQPLAKIPTFRELQSRPPKGVFRLDRQRRHERKKALKGRGFMSALRSVVADKVGDKIKERKR